MLDLEKLIEEELSSIKASKPAIVFAESLDSRVIESACYLARFCKPVFLENEERIRDVISKELPDLDQARIDFTISESAFIDISSRNDLVEEFAGLCLEYEKEYVNTIKRAVEMVKEPARFGIYSVKAGLADMVVGGAVYEPIKFFRPALKVLKQHDIQCEAGVFILPDDYPGGIFPHRRPGRRGRKSWQKDCSFDGYQEPRHNDPGQLRPQRPAHPLPLDRH